MTDGITQFILKPTGPLAAGVALFGIVWGFFKGVESILSDDTKLEIAVWLVGVSVGKRVHLWPESLARTFEPIFGSDREEWRAWVISLLMVCISLIMAYLIYPGNFQMVLASLGDGTSLKVLAILLLLIIACCFLSITKVRLLLRWCSGSPSVKALILIPILDIVGAAWIGYIFVFFTAIFSHPPSVAPVTSFYGFLAWPFDVPASKVFFFVPFTISIWLWLYAVSGFILKAAHKFDVSLGWFISKADIEKKPLQSIGLVAGAIVAVVYWVIVVVHRVA